MEKKRKPEVVVRDTFMSIIFVIVLGALVATIVLENAWLLSVVFGGGVSLVICMVYGDVCDDERAKIDHEKWDKRRREILAAHWAWTKEFRPFATKAVQTSDWQLEVPPAPTVQTSGVHGVVVKSGEVGEDE